MGFFSTVGRVAVACWGGISAAARSGARAVGRLVGALGTFLQEVGDQIGTASRNTSARAAWAETKGNVRASWLKFLETWQAAVGSLSRELADDVRVTLQKVEQILSEMTENGTPVEEHAIIEVDP